jgi:hypothetical protein
MDRETAKIRAEDRRDRTYAERMVREFFAAIRSGHALEAAECYNEITGSLNCVMERNGVEQI